jgi:hypothetical protein
MNKLERLAIWAVVKNEDVYISGLIAFHLLQGVSDILIFDNQSTDGTMDTLAQISPHPTFRPASPYDPLRVSIASSH